MLAIFNYFKKKCGSGSKILASNPTKTMMSECPINLEWTISKDFLLALRNSTDDEYLETEKFTALHGSDVKYWLRFYPNGDNDERRGTTWIFLWMEFGNEKKIEAEFKILIKSAGWSGKLEHVFEVSCGWGVSFCSTNELFDSSKNFIVDGKFTVKVKGILSIDNFESKPKINFYNLWNVGFEDFAIFADGKKIEVHKNVLAAQSPVFAAMLKPHTKEAIENKVVITDFSFEIVEKAVKLCYHHDIAPDTSIDDFLMLLKFADKYDITNLKDNLGDYLGNKLTVSNVCEIAKCAIDGNAVELQKKCLDFLVFALSKKECIPNMEILEKSFLVAAVTHSSRQKYVTL